MNKRIIPIIIAALLFCSFAHAQARIFIGPGRFYGNRYGRPHYNRRMERRPDNRPPYKPTVNLSVGYGFPNADKDQLLDFDRYYKGNFSQNGPVTGALDYQFSRNMSVGVMVAHGRVSVPYYDYNSSSAPSFTGSLNNWAFMLNVVRYMPLSPTVVPYFRTAIGVNAWKQDYSDVSGNKIFFGATPSDLAYQLGLGAKFNVSKNAGVFIEAGYGKYILHGGLALKF